MSVIKVSGKIELKSRPFNGRRSVLLCGIATCALAFAPLNTAEAGPTGGNVVAGDATITQSGSTTTINQLSDRAVIEWDDFSIGADELAQFLQNNSDASVLNKVMSSIPSSIMGQLTATGNVFLINPSGVVIGGGAQINANSFIASTLNLPTDDFMDGGDMTFVGDSAAAIINLGEIRAGGGDVYLLARQVTNAGTITAHQGEVGLAAGSEIYLSAEDENGTRITVKSNEFAEELKDKIGVDNQGAIEAARAILTAHNGDIYSMAVNNSGTIKATGLSKNADGTISLFATSSGSHSAGKVRNSGTLTAKAYNGGGGRVVVTGDDITLASTSVIDVSADATFVPPTPAVKPDAPETATADNRGDGQYGGGTILIGGDYQGQGDAVPTANTVTVETGSLLKANAGDQGDGGKVIVWADDTTSVSGTIEAKGGTTSGDGGFIETSGKDTLTVDEDTIINASAVNGNGGQWLLDPTNITVSDSGGDVSTSTINATLNGGADVTIQTSDSGVDDGDITVTNATIDKSTSNNDATLSFIAHNNINVSDSSITSTSGDALSVIFNSNSDETGGGAISVTNTTITTSGGDVVMGGGVDPLTTAAIGVLGQVVGVELNNAQITTGAGDVTITGEGYSDSVTSNQYGVYMHSSSVVGTTSGIITITGTGGAGDDDNYGVYVNGSGTEMTSVDGDIILTGTGGSSGAAGSNTNYGIYFFDGWVRSTGTGTDAATIAITGTGGAGEDSNYGVNIRRANSGVTSIDGDIAITGTGGTNGLAGSQKSYGVSISDDNVIESTGTGADAATITITGTGGAADGSDYGVVLSAGTIVTSIDGDVVITGQGGANGTSTSNGNLGIYISNGATVESTGLGADAATITITGIGADGRSNNYGVRVSDSTITSVDGDIVIDGEGSTDIAFAGNNNYGLYVTGGAIIESTGTGADAATITITGVAGAGVAVNGGIRMFDIGTTITSVDGDIVITGIGGADGVSNGNSNYGFYVSDGVVIESTGTGADAATITITGTGGVGRDYNYGAVFTGAGTGITSVDGDIVIIGQGGTNGASGSDDNYGIYFDDGAVITSTGTTSDAATITMIGTGGAASGNDNIGVLLSGSGGSINSIVGNITMTGQGGTDGSTGSSYQEGVRIRNGFLIKSTGTGTDAATITITGTGGAGEDYNYGVNIVGSGTEITSVDGDIVITGQGGSNGDADSNYNRGVYVYNGAVIESTGTGADAATITITGTGGAGQDNNRGVYVDGSDITSIDGDIVITGTGGSNGASGSANNYGVYVHNGAVVESTGTGADAATITITGTGGAGEDENVGVRIASSGTLITSADGDIVITGQGGSNGASGSNNNFGVFVVGGAGIESTGVGADAATITITGTGGAGDSGNIGIRMQDAGALITSVDGDIIITGQGTSSVTGGSINGYGVLIQDGAVIESTGTGADAATITITGTGGAGEDYNRGVSVNDSGTTITSIDGDIVITGQGGSNGTTGSDSNLGVAVSVGAVIESTGTGADAATITITGTGGAGEDDNYGVNIVGSGTEITSVDGDIVITGTGGSNGVSGSTNNYGVYVYNGAVVESTGTGADAAMITITGTGAEQGTSNNLGILLDASNASITSVDGGVVIVGDAGGGTNGGLSLNDATSLIQSTGLGNIDVQVDGAQILGQIAANSGDITIIHKDADGSIGLGSGAGDLQLDATELSLISTTSGDIIIGDAVNGTGDVVIDGVDVFANTIDVYGGSITMSNISNIDGSSSTFTARTGDLTLFDDSADDVALDEIKAYYQTLVGDLILAPTVASTSIGIAGGAGTFNFTEAELQGFTQIGGNLVIGDPTSGAGTITINALNLSAETYGFGVYGDTLTLAGDIQSGADLVLAADSMSWGGYDLIANDDIIITTQNTTYDIGVSGGAGTIQITDAMLDDVFAGNDGTGDLIIGDATSGSGIISIDGLDLSAQIYGLKFYGSSIDFNGQSISSGGDLTLGTDELLNFTSVLNAKGTIELAPMTGVGITLNDTAGTIQYGDNALTNGPFSLGLLNNDSDASGGEGLIIGSVNGGDVIWNSTTHDVTAYDVRTGADLYLVNSNLAASYGLGDGTTGDITFTTAQMNAMQVGGQLVIGTGSTTGAIDIADLSSETGVTYGLVATGGTISIGGWNGGDGANDITLTSTTGGITSSGGLITANDLYITSAGDVGTSGAGLNVDLVGGDLTYQTAGDLYLTNAGDLNIVSGVQTAAGDIDIATIDGAISIDNGLTTYGNVSIEAGGTDNDVTISDAITNHAGVATTLDVIAGGSIILNSGSDITSTTSSEIDVILNADRDANKAGAISVTGSDITTNGGDIVMGGGVDPTTDYAYGVSLDAYNNGIELNNVSLSTGAGDVTLSGHGYDDLAGASNRGVSLVNGTDISTTSGNITIAGQGGEALLYNNGVRLEDTTLSVVSGDMSITGVGGSTGQTGSNQNRGVLITSGTIIESTGTGVTAGTITIDGTGDNGDASNMGVFVQGNDAIIRTEDGDLTIIGTGGSNGQTGSDNNYGIGVDGAIISATGDADITMAGIAGAGDNSNRGVYIYNDASVSIADGALTITGTAGSNGQTGSDGNYGINISGASIYGTSTSSSAGDITITGTGANGEDTNSGVYMNASSLIRTQYNDVVITGTGGSNGQTGSNANRGVWIDDSDIQSTSSGVNAGTITITGTGGSGESFSSGVRIEGATTDITTVDGDITITGFGGTNESYLSSYARGVFITNGVDIISTGISSNAANIAITGTGGKVYDSSYGAYIATDVTISAGYGDITITGEAQGLDHWGGGDTLIGVRIYNSEIYTNGVGSNAGNITIIGTGGAGLSNNIGSQIEGSDIYTVDGDIIITGTGGATDDYYINDNDDDFNLGVRVLNGATIETTGTGSTAGNITITGTAGTSYDTGYGVLLEDTGGYIRAVDGDIDIVGTGGGLDETVGGYNYGVYIRDDFEISTSGTDDNAGDISITGTGGAGLSNNSGILTDGASTLLLTDAGDITITGYGNGLNSSSGIDLDLGTIETNIGAITLTGYSSDDILSEDTYGVDIAGAVNIISSGVTNAGDITISGVSRGYANNNGMILKGNVTAASADIIIDAQDQTSGSVDHYNTTALNLSGTLQTALDGNITITGVSNDGGGFNKGINLTGSVITEDGDIYITAVSGTVGTNNHALFLTGATIQTDDGNITLDGTGGLGGNSKDIRTSTGVVIESLGSVGGDITFIVTEDIVLSSSTTTTAGNIVFKTRTNDATIGIGSGSTNALLTDAYIATLSAGTGYIFGTEDSGANVYDIAGNVTFGSTGDVYLYGSSLSLGGDFTAARDIIVNVDDVTYSSGTMTAGNDLFIGNQTDNRSIGLGGGTGDLSLDETLLNALVATSGDVVIGDETTTSITSDSLNMLSGSDVTLRAGTLTLNNGATFGGELLVEALTGNVVVNGGALTADTQLIVDVQQGEFKTNQGASVFDVTSGGYYTLYTGGLFDSDVLLLQSNATTTYLEDSTSLPFASLATGQNHIVLRNDLSQSILENTDVSAIANDVQQVAQQTSSSGNSPSKVANTVQLSGMDAPENIGEGDIDVNTDNGMNTSGAKGIGVTTNRCRLNSNQVIICGNGRR